MSVRFLAAGLCLGAFAFTGPSAPKLLEQSQVAREFDQRAWQHQHGLPNDRVWAIYQTRDGYIWVGTQRGLARFDGVKFGVFDHANTLSLTNDDCRSLVEDRDGHLWIGTMRGLLRKKGTEIALVSQTPELCVDYRYGLCASQSGGVWAGAGGLLAWFGDGEVRSYLQRSQLPPPPAQQIRAFEEENGKVLWLGSTTGLLRFSIQEERFELALTNAGLSSLPAMAAWRSPTWEQWLLLAEPPPETRAQKAWLASIKDGCLTRTPIVEEPDLQVTGRSYFLVGDRTGALWMPSHSSGINRWVQGEIQQLSVRHTRKDDVVLSAFCDREGNFWIGTSWSGLQRWTPRRAENYTTAAGLAHDNVWSICQGRDGSVWIGTDGGVSRFKDGQFTSYTGREGLPLADVRAVAEDHEGTIWVGTMRSMACIRGDQIVEANLPGLWEESKVRAMHAGRDGSVWIGTVRGLTCLRNGERTKYTRENGLGSDEVRAILESRTGDLWIGTLGGGLSRLREGRITTLTTTNGLSSDNVWALHEDGDGVLWIGTENGLNRLQDGQLSSFTKDQGLPDNLVNCILEDDFGRLWIGHDRGIYWVWKKELNALAKGLAVAVPGRGGSPSRPAAQIQGGDGRFGETSLPGLVRAVSYDESDGLPTRDVNGQKSNPAACKTRDGRLWFPTSAGVAVINPAAAVHDEVAPIAVVEEVRANGKLLYSNQPNGPGLGHTNALASAPGPGFDLPPGGARVLEFRFTANTFLAPEKARFRYRLAGLSDHWIDTGTRREAILTDLRPGKYRFEVMAGNHRGVWQGQGYGMAFSVAPFFYQAWWFYPACAGALASLVGLVVVWRVRELRRIHALERQNALNEQRKRIARDIHDELGASLTRIAQLGSETEKNVARPERARQQAQHISRIAEEAVDSIGGLVWANNPEYDTLEDLVAYLREYAASYLAESEVRVRFDLPEAVPPISVSGLYRRNLVMLVKEALQNVRKHASAKNVSIRMEIRDSSLELEVGDDGQGLAAGSSKRQGNGLANMRERVAELNGEFHLESQPGNGTRILVRVPLRASTL